MESELLSPAARREEFFFLVDVQETRMGIRLQETR